MISPDYLKSRLKYHPESGRFYWIDSGRYGWNGKEAGSPDKDGYIIISINKKLYRRGRLAWLYMTGEWPITIDHINGERADDRWCNLRNVEFSINQQNRRGAYKNNKTGFLGVSATPYGYVATIKFGGKSKHLGSFRNASDAYAAYLDAKRNLHSGNTI